MKKQSLGRTAVLAMATAALTFTYAASAANIGFVVGSDGVVDKTFDQGWVNRLTSQGHTVTAVPQTTVWSPSLTYDLFIISQDVSGGTAWNNFGAAAKPLLMYEPATLYNNIFGAAAGGNTCTNLTISLSSHPLAAGLSGDVVVYTGSGNMPTFNPAAVSSGSQVIGINAYPPPPPAAAQGAFVLLEAGALGAGGSTWSAMRIGLPCYDNWDPALVTVDGWKLLDGAVAYALVPEPSSLALFGLGVAFILARRQRR